MSLRLPGWHGVRGLDAMHLRHVRFQEECVDPFVVAPVAGEVDGLPLRCLHGLHLRGLGLVFLLVLLFLLVALKDVVQVAVPAEILRSLSVADLHVVLDPHEPAKNRLFILLVPTVIEHLRTRTTSFLALARFPARVVLARPLVLLRTGGIHLLHGFGSRRAIA